MSPSLFLACGALLPALTGPMPAENAMLVTELCGGGKISIPLEKSNGDDRDCHPKGCHAGACRERSKRSI